MKNNMPSLLEKLDEQLPALTGANAFCEALQKYKHFFIYLAVIALLSYTYDLFNFSINIDSEIHAVGPGPNNGWVMQGRWGMYLLSWLILPDTVMPVSPMLVALTGLAVGVFFFTRILDCTNTPAAYIAAPLAIACPVLYYALYFTTLGYGLGVGFALANIAIYLLTRWRWVPVLFSIPVLCFAIGIYQAVLPLLAVIFCTYLLNEILHDRLKSPAVLFRYVLLFAVVMSISCGLYVLITKLSLRLAGVPYYSQYMNEFVDFQFTAKYLKPALHKTLLAGWHYYTGHREFYAYNINPLLWLFCFCIFLCVLRIITCPQKILMKILAGIIFLAVLFAPLSMLLMNSGEMPPRTMLGIPYVLAGLAIIAVTGSSNTARIAICLLVFICFYRFTIINNRFVLANHMAWQSDREFSVLLLDRMGRLWDKLPPKDRFTQYPVELVGVRETFESPILLKKEVIGTSFYYWSAGSIDRMIDFLLTMGVFDYKPAVQQQRLSVVDAAEKMPEWPKEGSVDVVNGVIVVKIGPYNPHQIVSMCQPPEDKNDFCVKTVPSLIL